MYNRLCKYPCEEKLLYSKQSVFQKGQSTDHAIVHLVNQIYESFESDNYTLGVFIDLSKAFYTVGHIKCGVPQGSILGLLLFLLYVNDYLRNVLVPIIFADDTSFF